MSSGPTFRSERLLGVLALAVFFVSGFLALLYQVVWQRMLTLFSGADVYSVTIVVAAFMAGLGCGSLAGGALADRLSRGGSLLLFSATEISIALFAFGSKSFFYDLLYLRWSGLAASPLLLAVVLFLSLLWPTFAMGMSLPLLSRALTRQITSAAGTGRRPLRRQHSWGRGRGPGDDVVSLAPVRFGREPQGGRGGQPPLRPLRLAFGRFSAAGTQGRQAPGEAIALVSQFLQTHTPVLLGPNHSRSALTDINTDLFPKDEYQVPRPSRSLPE